jgi:hypothetical protein
MSSIKGGPFAPQFTVLPEVTATREELIEALWYARAMLGEYGITWHTQDEFGNFILKDVIDPVLGYPRPSTERTPAEAPSPQ